jgi:hypothetical protein
MGEQITDSELLARLISLISPTLTSPFGSPAQIRVIDDLLALAKETNAAVMMDATQLNGDPSRRPRKGKSVLNLLHDARTMS